MAKVSVSVSSVRIRYAEAFSVKGLNRARKSGNYGDDKARMELRTLLATDCWRDDTNGVAVVDKIDNTWYVDGKPVSLRELAHVETEKRREEWNYLKSAASRDSMKEIEFRVFEKLYTEGGKLIPIKYIMGTGNRRHSEYFAAMVMRLSGLKDIETGLPFTDFTDEIPVQIRDLSNEYLRLKVQVAENEEKTQCQLDSSMLDKLLNAVDAFALGASRASVVKMFKRGVGDKLADMVMFDAKYPRLNIIAKCQLPSTDPEWIPIPSVEYTMLQSFKERETPEKTDAYNRKLASKGLPPMPVCTEEEVKKYFDGIKSKGPKAADRANDKNNIRTLAKTSKNETVRAAMEWAGHADAPAGALKKLADIAPADSAIHQLYDDQDYPDVELILSTLVAIPKGKKRNGVLSALLETLGVKRPEHVEK